MPAHSYERKPELGYNRKRPKRPCGCHIEEFPSRPLAVVLEPGVDHLDVGEAQLGCGCLDPVQSTPLRIDQGEGRGSIRDGQWKPWQSSA